MSKGLLESYSIHKNDNGITKFVMNLRDKHIQYSCHGNRFYFYDDNDIVEVHDIDGWEPGQSTIFDHFEKNQVTLLAVPREVMFNMVVSCQRAV